MKLRILIYSFIILNSLVLLTWYYKYESLIAPSVICKEKDGVNLVSNYDSCVDVNVFLEKLKKNHIHYSILESSESAKGFLRPRFARMVVLLNDDGKILGEGDIKVSFVNEYLSSVDFFPKNYDSYVKNLVTIESDFLKISFAKDFWGREYVHWEDVRLEEFARRWVWRFA